MTIYDSYSANSDDYLFEDMLHMLQSSQPSVRSQAAYELGASGNPKAIDPLIILLEDIDIDVKEVAIRSLGLLAEQLKDHINLGEVLLSLINNMNDSNPTIRCRCATALGRLGDRFAIDSLVSALRDENTSVRVCAADAIGWMKDTSTSTVNNLIQGLYDSNQLVRSSCINALVHTGEPNIIKDHLIDMLKDSDPYVRQDAATALGNIREISAINALFDYIQNEVEIKPSLAAQALGMLGSQAFDALINRLSSNDPNIRYWSVVALGYIGDDRAISYLKNITEYDRGETRTRAKVVTAAKKAIKKIEQPKS